MKNWFMAGRNPKDYELGIDTIITYQGKNSGYIKSIATEPEGFGTMMQMVDANEYRHKRIRFSGLVKSEGIEGWAGLWMRVDDAKKDFTLDNMGNRPIKGTTDWQKYEVVLDVPENSVSIAFGLLLQGKGQAWVSDVHFEEVESDIPVTGSLRKYPDKPANLEFAQ